MKCRSFGALSLLRMALESGDCHQMDPIHSAVHGWKKSKTPASTNTRHAIDEPDQPQNTMQPSGRYF
ncbi:AAEL004111-PA [Aedes aegypti]|uniref:AAEL004111-PA n=1 Tax=Aedes aegypti TaxID=7159 RepID=Q17DL7_AEDAE|nr:AAEL004111-PA [Aedes aegypti]